MHEHVGGSLSVGELAIPFRRGLSVREILDATKLRVRSSCGGIGACGRCMIRIEQGESNPPTAAELNRLGQERIDSGLRLACQVRPLHDARISIEDPAPSSNWRALSETDYRPAEYNASFGGFPARSGYGAAVDLGTTQIRISLLDLRTGKHVAGRSGLNPQASFGADVLTRLMAAAGSAARAAELKDLVRNAIKDGLLDISEREGIALGKIGTVVISGNTAMLALLSGHNYEMLLHPDNWMREVDCGPEDTKALCGALGLDAEAHLELVQPFAGFVGSDLLAGALATDLTGGSSGSLLIDFGTNSEMALWDGEVLWVTSAAGGPAFEGCGISSGMPAEPGAVHNARLKEDASEIVLRVLGGGRAKGICGSGLVDVIAELLRIGKLKRNGRLSHDIGGNGFALTTGAEGIAVKNRDIDAFQRAKGAIGAGALCLLETAGMRIQELRRICVCGAFGRYLDIRNAQAIGLLPTIPAEGIELCGNTSLAGSEHILLSPDGAAVLALLRSKCRIINLSLVPGFDELFIENLYLQPMQAERDRMNVHT